MLTWCHADSISNKPDQPHLLPLSHQFSTFLLIHIQTSSQNEDNSRFSVILQHITDGRWEPGWVFSPYREDEGYFCQVFVAWQTLMEPNDSLGCSAGLYRSECEHEHNNNTTVKQHLFQEYYPESLSFREKKHTNLYSALYGLQRRGSLLVIQRLCLSLGLFMRSLSW